MYDRQSKPGGLNEYGIAAYKVPDFAQREVEWLLSIGGITMEYGKALGDSLSLKQLRADFDAVFLGIGLGGVNDLGIDGESLSGVRNAVDLIAELRQSDDLSNFPVGRRVVVIGGGNTAIDAAVQGRKLGAEVVTLVYRRGSDAMSATDHEQDFAQQQGVHVIHWAQPVGFVADGDALSGVEFEYTEVDANGKLRGSGDRFVVAADMALKAIGQVMLVDGLNDGESLNLNQGRMVVDADYATSLPGVWAGGDCVGGKVDLTVQAVEDGKRAAAAIDRALSGKNAEGNANG